MKTYKIVITQDEDAENPLLTCDGNVKFCLLHKRYDLQNDTNLTNSDADSWEELEELICDEYDVKEILPVFMYDHSGITINTTGFSCRWDSGQIGFAFVDSEALKATGLTIEDDLKKFIINNVKVYNDYLSGNCWEYAIIDEDTEEIVDSCCGFVGDQDYCLSEAESMVEYLQAVELRKYGKQ